MANSKTIVEVAEVQAEVKGDDVVIILKGAAIARGAESKSGKSLVVASTHGNVMLPGGLNLGLNCYRRKA